MFVESSLCLESQRRETNGIAFSTIFALRKIYANSKVSQKRLFLGLVSRQLQTNEGSAE